MNITLLPLKQIDEDKDQPRYQFNQEALEELANSIKEIGLLSPIKVRKLENGRYMIIYGNRRYKAATMVGLAEIPCIISDATNDLDIYFEQIAENLTREDFSPIEEAEAFDKLMNDTKFRSSIKLLSNKLGKTESYIKNKCELLKFSSAVKKLIVSGTQIKKGFLIEDQLLPLKDLPLEHSNPIALIAAKDELPVSDVKKLAKMFKDSSVPDAVKEKLLLKDGPGLIDSWSVYEQNRKEKIAREKEKAEKAKEIEAARIAEEAAQASIIETQSTPFNSTASNHDYEEETDSAWMQEQDMFTSTHANASWPSLEHAINDSTLEQKFELEMNQCINNEKQIVDSINHALEQRLYTDPDALEQLTLTYLSHLQQLEVQWKAILKEIALQKIDN